MNQKIKNLFYLLSLILFPAMSQAVPPVAELHTILNNIHSLQAGFSESVSKPNGQTLPAIKGQVYLQRPAQFRWEIQQPSKQLLITDGENFYNYDIELEQVTIQKLNRAVMSTPIFLLSMPAEEIEKYFTVIKKSSPPDVQWFHLQVKEHNNNEQMQLFESIEMIFKQGALTTMSFMDNLGQNAELQFHNLVINRKLSAKLFSFNSPKNVDVIDWRSKFEELG